MDATYKEFIEEGPIVYIGKVDSLKAYAGRNRVMLEWQKLLDPRAKTAKYSGKTERSLLNYN